MAQSSRRRSAVNQAIDDVLRRLSTLSSALPRGDASPCREVDALRERALEYQREKSAWSASEPAATEKEQLMKRVLKLHLEVARLERSYLPPPPK